MRRKGGIAASAVLSGLAIAGLLALESAAGDRSANVSSLADASHVSAALAGDQYADALDLQEIWQFPVHGCQHFTFGPSQAGYCLDGVVAGMTNREIYIMELRIHGDEPTDLQLEIWDTMDALQSLPDTDEHADDRRALDDHLLDLMTQLGSG